MSSNDGLANRLSEYEAIAGTWRYITEHRHKVAKLTPTDVQETARTFLVRENRTVATIRKREAAQ
jgi:predicted Zn-dependent peptidase